MKQFRTIINLDKSQYTIETVEKINFWSHIFWALGAILAGIGECVIDLGGLTLDILDVAGRVIVAGYWMIDGLLIKTAALAKGIEASYWIIDALLIRTGILFQLMVIALAMVLLSPLRVMAA